jgi:hypothetical protein
MTKASWTVRPAFGSDYSAADPRSPWANHTVVEECAKHLKRDAA